MYLYIFYCLCSLNDKMTDMLEEKYREQRYPILDMDKDESLLNDIENKWKYMFQYNIKDKQNINALRWEV